MTWDLAELLAEREQPKDEVILYLNEAASFAKKKLVDAQAHAKADDIAAIDEKLTEVDALLEQSKYVVKLTGVPPRMREDIHRESLKKYPIKGDFMGNDDPANQRLRMEYENNLIWAAMIESVVNPHGQENTDWSYSAIVEFSRALPGKAANAIDKAINELTKAAEEYTVGAKGADFGLTL